MQPFEQNSSKIAEEAQDKTANDNVVTDDTEAEVDSARKEENEKDTEITRLKDSLLRAIAENENFQKRVQREKEDLEKYSLSKFARDLLTVLDSFNRAITAAGDSNAMNKKLLEGIKITEKELLSVLGRYGVKAVCAAPGDTFDPKQHQAMVEVEHKDFASGSIAEVLQVGYMIHDRLLRPTLVSVVKASNNKTEPA